MHSKLIPISFLFVLALSLGQCASAQARRLSRAEAEKARNGMVLLKNENGILPLDKHKIKSIAVLGPDADPAVIGGGGSSLSTPSVP